MTQCVLNAAYNCHYYYSYYTHLHALHSFICTARLYACVVYATPLCLSVRLCVCHKSEFYKKGKSTTTQKCRTIAQAL